MTGAACMRGQVALIRGALADLDAVLESVELDPGFCEFVDWCEARGAPLAILSDGVDYFIRRLLARHGLQRGEQAHRQRHLVGQALRCQIGEIAAEGLQIRRARVQPIPFVGAQAIQQPLHPSHFLLGVQPRTLGRGEVMARVVKQVPGVDPGVRRIGYCCQR